MTVSVLWPTASVPLPNKQGYVLKWKPSVLRTDFEAGAARQRRRGVAAPTEVPVVWDLTQWQLMLFWGFYEHDAGEGSVWFGIPLLTYIGLATCEARFKGEPSAPKRAGHLWQVNATLEVREIPRLDGAGFAAIVNENPDALDIQLAAFQGVMQAPPLWESGNDLYVIYGENTDLLLPSVLAFHAVIATPPLWASGDDLWFIYGEDMAALIAACAAMRATSTDATLWTS